MNQLLNRESEYQRTKEILQNFDKNKNDLSMKRGIYLYGEPGTGKTTFIMNILKELDYDVISYDAGDIRNKSIIDTITKHNMSDKNVMSMFQKKVKKIAIVMDEIDGMNSGDKGGINTLIKLIRPKKTKKQKQEEMTLNPIICIGNYHIDKKIKELIKVCNSVELKVPTNAQISTIVKTIMPQQQQQQRNTNDKIVTFVQNDLRKLHSLWEMYHSDPAGITDEMMDHIFQMKKFNHDTKKITQNVINHSYSIDEHMTIMNETDRTIVGLLWHENIIDVLGKMDKKTSIPFYLQVLDNICFADYMDRITFQKQIWKFNEMSSLIKTFKNSKLFNTSFKKKPKFNPQEVRFTKVLTKYSTEYNNSLFIQNLCQQLNMDQRDLFAFFMILKHQMVTCTPEEMNHILEDLLENYEITKLDINRMIRYLEKYTKEGDVGEEENDNISLCEDI
jgi:DNA polymerase III delta prime subunit